MKKIKIILIVLLVTTCIISCKKTNIEKSAEIESSNVLSKVPDNFFKDADVPYDPNNFENISNATAPPSGNNDPNNGDIGIVLGN